MQFLMQRQRKVVKSEVKRYKIEKYWIGKKGFK